MNHPLPAAIIGNTGTAFVDLGGARPALIFLHGVGLDHTMWAAQAQAFARDWRVILPDMLGHGRSAPPAPDATIEDYADQIADLARDLGVNSAVVIGFSMGALVARALALRHPHWLRGAVLMNGVFDRAENVRAAIMARVGEVARGGPGANAEAALIRWFTPEYHRDHPDRIADLRARLHGNDPLGYLTTYRLFAAQDNFGADRLHTITVPTLVATGQDDPGSTPAMTLALAARIPGAQAAVLPGARHMMPVEQAAQTNALLQDFLARTIDPAWCASSLDNGVVPQ